MVESGTNSWPLACVTVIVTEILHASETLTRGWAYDQAGGTTESSLGKTTVYIHGLLLPEPAVYKPIQCKAGWHLGL